MAFKKFIINDEIIFDADANELKSISDSQECIMLNAPTARCLKLLLERIGHVVSRDEFLEEVWSSRGIVVSENTFYQNISLLRKSLARVGLTEDIIVTIRQKGFMISENSIITPVIDDESTLSGQFINPGFNKESAASLNGVQINGHVINEGSSKDIANMFRLSKWILIACLILIMVDIISLLVNYL